MPATTLPRRSASQRWPSISTRSSTYPGCSWIIPPGCDSAASARDSRPRRAARDGAVVQCVGGCAGSRTCLATLAGHHRVAHDFRAARLCRAHKRARDKAELRSEEHTSELQSLAYLVCRLLLEKKKKYNATLKTHHTIRLLDSM